MSSTFSWTPAQLSTEDEALVGAYKTVGRPLDDLPYTDDFDKLLELLGLDKSKAYVTWKRLLAIRKRGQLPRVGG